MANPVGKLRPIGDALLRPGVYLAARLLNFQRVSGVHRGRGEEVEPARSSMYRTSSRPWDSLDEWVRKYEWFWNEQSLLAAFLPFNRSQPAVGAVHDLRHCRFRQLQEARPLLTLEGTWVGVHPTGCVKGRGDRPTLE